MTRVQILRKADAHSVRRVTLKWSVRNWRGSVRDLKVRRINGSSNLLVDEKGIIQSGWIILECWLNWLCKYISISDDGSVGGYVEKYLPGWLLLQLARQRWPRPGDHYFKYGKYKHTSVALINVLRSITSNGYLVDKLSYDRWLFITDYSSDAFKPILKSVEDQEMPDREVAYQILLMCQVQPGIRSDWCYWLPLDLNKPIDTFGR